MARARIRQTKREARGTDNQTVAASKGRRRRTRDVNQTASDEKWCIEWDWVDHVLTEPFLGDFFGDFAAFVLPALPFVVADAPPEVDRAMPMRVRKSSSDTAAIETTALSWNHVRTSIVYLFLWGVWRGWGVVQAREF